VPKYVEFRDEMPMTVSDKIFKKVLRDAAIAKFKEQGKPAQGATQ
jgi:acyl-coenzyme A synthetase/AMP-(fatty) acid ligase